MTDKDVELVRSQHTYCDNWHNENPEVAEGEKISCANCTNQYFSQCPPKQAPLKKSLQKQESIEGYLGVTVE